MIFKQNSHSKPGRKSYGLALVFMLIAVIGILMSFSSLPQNAKSDRGTQPVSAEKEAGTTFASSYPGFVIKTIIITCAIIVLFVLGAKLYKKQQRSEIFDKIKIDIIGRKYIDAKHYLIMVSVQSRQLLLGVSDNSINLIAEYDDNTSAESNIATDTLQNDDQFSRILKRIKIKSRD